MITNNEGLNTTNDIDLGNAFNVLKIEGLGKDLWAKRYGLAYVVRFAFRR
jgi:hypothetical protein